MHILEMTGHHWLTLNPIITIRTLILLGLSRFYSNIIYLYDETLGIRLNQAITLQRGDISA